MDRGIILHKGELRAAITFAKWNNSFYGCPCVSDNLLVTQLIDLLRRVNKIDN